MGYGADLSISASTELNNGAIAGMTWGASIVNDGVDSSTIVGDAYPVITLESSMGKLSAGDADAIGAASDHFAAGPSDLHAGLSGSMGNGASVFASYGEADEIGTDEWNEGITIGASMEF